LEQQPLKSAVLQGFSLKNCKSLFQNRARLAHSQLVLEQAQLIDESLTIHSVNSIIGIDIAITSTESIDHPSLTLKQIYQSVGKDYNKKKWEAERTVYVLDYENVYLCVRNRNKSLNELLTCLDGLIP
jgi:hypothetical protein